MLAIENVDVAFGTTKALDDFSVSVDEGRVVAVLGPSGSGKSTLLRVIAGLQRPDAGRIVWRGRDLTDVPPHRRRFAMMFQDYALFPHRTVAGNVRFGLEMQGHERPGDRVAEVLAMVGLAGYGDRSVGTLSGGEQQRVGLARALAPAPELLLLDEPLGALDRALREKLMVDLDRIFSTLDMTVLYVTHDQEEAFALADDIIVMRDGGLVQHAAPEALWHEPANAFVAEFLGFTVIEGQVRNGMLHTDLGSVRDPTGRAATAAVRRDRAHVDPAGPISGTVVSIRFVEGSHMAIVDVGSGIELRASTDGSVEIGDRVAVQLEAGALIPLAR